MTRSEFREICDKVLEQQRNRTQAEAEHGTALIGAMVMARHCGAEANANRCKYISADDRSDIAGKLNTEWNALSEATANLLIDEWQRGWRS